MDKKITLFIAPVVLLLVMLIDGQVSLSMRSLMVNEAFLNSHILLLIIILMSLYFSKNYLLIMTTFIGLIHDIYYYGIVGINIVVLPLTVMLIYFVFKYVKLDFFTILLSMIVFITIMDLSAYMLQVVFGLRKPNFSLFIVDNLGPTILFNIVLCVIGLLPINYYLKNIKKII